MDFNYYALNHFSYQHSFITYYYLLLLIITYLLLIIIIFIKLLLYIQCIKTYIYPLNKTSEKRYTFLRVSERRKVILRFLCILIFINIIYFYFRGREEQECATKKK